MIKFKTIILILAGLNVLAFECTENGTIIAKRIDQEVKTTEQKILL